MTAIRLDNISFYYDDPYAQVFECVSLTIDSTCHQARLGEHELELTSLEFNLLAYLARHPGQVLGREQLLEQVWGYDYHGDLRAVDAAVKRLRSRLRQADPETELIRTVRGVGYKLAG